MSSHHVVIKILDLDNDGDNEIVNSTGVWSDELPMSVIQIFLKHEGQLKFVLRNLNYQPQNMIKTY